MITYIETFCDKNANNRVETDGENAEKITVVSHAEATSHSGELMYFEQQKTQHPPLLMLERMSNHRAWKRHNILCLIQIFVLSDQPWSQLVRFKIISIILHEMPLNKPTK
ncbi:hypothetical protein J6590_047522 [Homalodisca vitripennis]|nr:hypothetical protein J6590_047522 [Homalodisca vitripennis]